MGQIDTMMIGSFNAYDVLKMKCNPKGLEK